MTAHLFAVKAPPSLGALPASGWLEKVGEPKRTGILRQRNAQAAATRLCAEILLQYALYSAYGVKPFSLAQACTPQGKPFFTDPAAPHFSLSHSDAMAFCAVHHAPVGADVEHIRPVAPGLARRIMSDSEFEVFDRSHDKDGFFFKIWTLKESYLKQTGHGIAYDLKSLSFSISEKQNVSFNRPHYVFKLYDLPGGYQACACVEKGTLPGHVACLDFHALMDFF
ncbi:MAG: 4'-phosphopantetheinyl transferase family protein [Bacillota bacterium]